MNKRTVLVWFRNDLRIHDNEMLTRASERGEVIVPVYCFDPRYYTQTKYSTNKTGILRAQFINESVECLQKYFQSYGSNLIIKTGLPEEVIPVLASRYQVDEVYHHREVADEETTISSLLEDALWRMKINLRHFIGHTLSHKEDFPFPVKDIPDCFGVFRKKLERECLIRACFKTSNKLKVLAEVEETKVPSLEELGFDTRTIPADAKITMRGGEEEGRKLLQKYLNEKNQLSFVHLSPYLALGCLSVHEVYFSVVESDINKKAKERILTGLWWKDYYRFMFKKYGNLLFKEGGYTGVAPIVRENQEEIFKKWKSGKTDCSEVNEAMKKLNQTGYIDMSSRTLVATYLIHELQVNWLLGAAYFEEVLIDYNPSSNYGSWAHIAGVGSSELHNRKSTESLVI